MILKNKFSVYILGFALVSCSPIKSNDSINVFQVSANQWLSKEKHLEYEEKINLSKADYYDVPLRNIKYTLQYLVKKEYHRLTLDETISLTENHYIQKNNKHPYLVRAVLVNLSSNFYLSLGKKNNILYINSGALGKIENLTIQPLIVNLKSNPKRINISTSLAM